MKTYWLVYRKEANYDKPSEETIIGVFKNEEKATQAVEYAEKLWGEDRDADYVFYEARPLKAFTKLDEFTCWNDFPKKALSTD